MEQSACIQPGSNSVPTGDGRSEVGCKSWKCDSSYPGQCYTSRASSSKIVVCVSVGFFLKPRAETSFCLKEERSATAAPSPPPPCSKRTPTRFHRRLVGTLSRALLGTPPSLAKQVAKIATRGRSPPRCFCCCLVWEKVWRYLGMVGILPSQLYLDAATPLSPEHTFPVAPGCQPPSSTTPCLRLDVFRSSTSTPCLGAPTIIYMVISRRCIVFQ